MENKRANLVRNTMSRRKHRSMVPLGILVFVLALVGLVTIFSLSFNMTKQILDNTPQKRKMEHFILPLIMLDPLTFDSPETADPQILLQSSVWSALLSKDKDQLPKDDYGYILVPKSDVDVQGAKLYGSGTKLQHQSFGNEYENYFLYNEEQEHYQIQLFSEISYSPRILSTTLKDELYTLEVGYIPPGNLWRTDTGGNLYEPEPDKVMLLELKKVKDGYNIVALKDGPTMPVPVQPAPTPPQGSLPPEEDPDAAPDTESSSDASSVSSAVEEETLPPVFDTVEASSSAEGDDKYNYDPENMMDGDMETAWIEGQEDDGIGEWVEFRAEQPQVVSEIRMTNGYTNSEATYNKNNRISKIQIEFSDGTTLEKDLSNLTWDKAGVIALDAPVTTEYVKLTILEVTSGSKFQDTCISEVEFS